MARPGGRLVGQLADALGEMPPELELQRYKQGIYSFSAPGRYLRVARSRTGQRWIEREYASWQQLRALGLDAAVSPRLQRLDLAGGWRALVDTTKQPIEPTELPAALGELVPLLVERATPQTVRLPHTIAFGHAFLAGDPALAALARLPPLAQLEAAFAAPLPVGLFHCDLHSANIMRLGGRFSLNDLKSCREARLIDLELLRTIVRHYPRYKDRSTLERMVMAASEGWQHPAIAPLVSLVRLPRDLWTPLCLCEAIGLCHGLEKRPAVDLRNHLRASLMRPLLQRRLCSAVEAAATGAVDLVDQGAPAG